MAGINSDLNIVFDVEKEHGTFYQGWEEDPAQEFRSWQDNAVVEEEDDTSDDPNTDHNVPQVVTTSPTEASVPPPKMDKFPRSSTIPVTIGASPGESSKTGQPRRESLPTRERPGPPSLLSISPRARRSSTVEPSPLARLFVRSPPNESHLQKALGHRPTFSSGTLNHLFGHSEHSKPPTSSPTTAMHSNPLETIPAGKRVSFNSPRNRTNEIAGGDEDPVAKASKIAEDIDATRPQTNKAVTEMQQQLNNIEQQQKQVNKMLERILAMSSSAAAEGRGRDSSGGS